MPVARPLGQVNNCGVSSVFLTDSTSFSTPFFALAFVW
jgi:hypothetical protein